MLNNIIKVYRFLNSGKGSFSRWRQSWLQGSYNEGRRHLSLSCVVRYQIVSLQYLSRSSLHRLAGLPCGLFLPCGLQLVAREVHRSSLRRLICSAQDHFIFLTVLIISMTESEMQAVTRSKRVVVVDLNGQ